MKYANAVTAAVFVLFVCGLALSGALRQPTEVSTSERRTLAQFPEISPDSVFEGTFAKEYVAFLQEQAVLRDDFRALKSLVERKVLLKPENNGVYIVSGNIYDKFYGINQRYISRAATSINNIIASIDSDRVYLSVIPSKAQMLDRELRCYTTGKAHLSRFRWLHGVLSLQECENARRPRGLSSWH